MEQTIELDLGKIARILWKNVIWIIVSAIVGAALFFGGSKLFLTPKYTSSVSMYVNNNTEMGGTPININDINASQKLVNTYIVILKNDEVLDKVADELMNEYTEEELDNYIGLSEVNGARVLKADTLRNALTLTAVEETEVLQIKAETKNAVFSARVCNLVAEMAPDVLQRVIKSGSVEVIGQAKANFAKTSPNNTKNALVGALLGLALCISVILIRFLLDKTIVGEQDIKERLNLPVLGEIPDFESIQNNKGGYGYGK